MRRISRRGLFGLGALFAATPKLGLALPVPAPPPEGRLTTAQIAKFTASYHSRKSIEFSRIQIKQGTVLRVRIPSDYKVAGE